MNLLPTNLNLTVNGLDLSGWQDVNINLGIDILPWAASLQISFPVLVGYKQELPDIMGGDQAALILNGKPIITGRLITIAEEISAENHIFRLEVASKTLDLTDCSAEIPKNQMNSTNLKEIAVQICENFDIDVLEGPNLPLLDIEAFSHVLTETPFAILDRLCRLAGILFLDTPEGNILLSNVGNEKMASPLILGENVENISRQQSISGRYYEIRAIINNETILNIEPPSDEDYVGQIEALTQCAPAYDDEIPQTRKLLVPIEQSDPDYKVTQKRVAWEVARRMGRSCPIQVTVDSWLDDAGKVWTPNKLVTLDTQNDVQEYLITNVNLTKNMNGTRANLTLMPKSAFEPQPIVNSFEDAVLNQSLKNS